MQAQRIALEGVRDLNARQFGLEGSNQVSQGRAQAILKILVNIPRDAVRTRRGHLEGEGLGNPDIRESFRRPLEQRRPQGLARLVQEGGKGRTVLCLLIDNRRAS